MISINHLSSLIFCLSTILSLFTSYSYTSDNNHYTKVPEQPYYIDEQKNSYDGHALLDRKVIINNLLGDLIPYQYSQRLDPTNLYELENKVKKEAPHKEWKEILEALQEQRITRTYPNLTILSSQCGKVINGYQIHPRPMLKTMKLRTFIGSYDGSLYPNRKVAIGQLMGNIPPYQEKAKLYTLIKRIRPQIPQEQWEDILEALCEGRVRVTHPHLTVHQFDSGKVIDGYHILPRL